MYRHIVFIRLKNCSAANLERACAALEGLIGHVTGLRFIEVEKVEDPAENDGCHLCANMLYDTKEAMVVGRQNPAVQKVRTRI